MLVRWVVVRLIVVPCAFFVVDVPDKHTVTRDICVPTFKLTVFEQEVLVRVACAEDVAGVACHQWLQLELSRFADFDRSRPSELIFLIESVAGRSLAVVVVAAIAEGRVVARYE